MIHVHNNWRALKKEATSTTTSQSSNESEE